MNASLSPAERGAALALQLLAAGESCSRTPRREPAKRGQADGVEAGTIGGVMRLRSVQEELEAHLASPTGDARATGKAERKRYGTGEERFKLRASGLPAGDGTHVDIRVDTDVIGRAEVTAGRVIFRIESPTHVPAVRAGQVLRLAIGGVDVLAGAFRPE